MKKMYILLGLFLLFAGTIQAQKGDKAAATNEDKFVFTDVMTLPVTSVKDQSRSGTCWSFAEIAMIESALLHQDKGEFDLSEMWIVRNAYFDKVMKYVRMHGKANLSEGGVGGDVSWIIDKYGIVPEEVYPGLNYGTKNHVHAELDAAVKAYVDALLKNPNKALSSAWQEGLNGILDAYLGKVPETFVYKGKEYTPRSFAEALGLSSSNQVSVTSFTHLPMYRSVVLELPDNWIWSPSYNVELSDLEEIIDNALSAGYAVAWASDVSEKGFLYNSGFAVVPAATPTEITGSDKARWVGMTADELALINQEQIQAPVPEKEITAAVRQQAFDNYQTTDDHLMLIVGIAKDQNGRKFYKVKNSWGVDNPYGGYFYTSLPYVLYKTTTLYLNKAAIPAAVAGKLKE